MSCAGCPETASERLARKLDAASESAVIKLAKIVVPVAPHTRVRKGQRQNVDAHKRTINIDPAAEAARGRTVGDLRRPGTPKTKPTGKSLLDKKLSSKGPDLTDRETLPEGVQSGSGTKEDPYVTDDVDVAAKLIIDDQDTPEKEARYVRLNQPQQVSTLLDKMKEMVDDAKAKGEKAPLYDLCRVSVPGSTLR